MTAVRRTTPERILKHLSDNKVLLAIIIFHLSINALVVRMDRTPLSWDESDYLTQSLQHFDSLARGDVRGFLNSLRGAYPPLHQLISVPFFALFGPSPDAAVLGVLTASAVFLISIYHIGRELHSREAGLLSAAIAALTPGIFTFSRTYYQQHTLDAAVALTLALLLSTRLFTKRKALLAFGLSLSLGALVRWSFSVFIIGPLCLYSIHFVQEAISSGSGWKKILSRVKWMLFLTGLGTLPAAIWYFANLHAVDLRLQLLTTHFNAFGPFATWTLLGSPNLLFYIRALHHYHLRPLLLGAAVLSLLYLAASGKILHRRMSFIGLWFLVPYLFFTFVIKTQKSSPHTTSYLGAIAILIAIGVMEAPKRIRKGAGAALLIAGLLQYFLLAFSGGPVDPRLRHDYGLQRPEPNGWNIQNFTRILNASLVGREEPSVLILYSWTYSITTLTSLQRTGELPPFRIVEVWECDRFSDLSCGKSEALHESDISQADIVLIGNGGPLGRIEHVHDYDRARQAMDASMASFEQVGYIEFPPAPPEDLHLDIYARRRSAPKANVSQGPPEKLEVPEPRVVPPPALMPYFDTVSESTVVNIARSAHILVNLTEAASPHALLLRYSGFRPEGTGGTRFSIAIGGILSANVTDDPPFPWTLVEVPIPADLRLNRMLDIQIASSTFLDKDGTERGISLDWFTLACETRPCLAGWTLE